VTFLNKRVGRGRGKIAKKADLPTPIICKSGGLEKKIPEKP